MTRAAIGRGVKLTSRSRPLRPADLVECDYILGMDAANLAAIRRAAEYWKSKHAVPADYDTKVRSSSSRRGPGPLVNGNAEPTLNPCQAR